MATKSFLLSDRDTGVFYLEDVKIGPADVGGAARGWSVVKKTLHGGSSDGVDVVRVNNGAFSFDVLPTRGMSIWKAWVGNEEIGWKSPVHGPVHPKYVPLMEPSGLGWLDGFDEMFVRCGLESNGAPDFDEKTGRLKYPLHGRIGNKPAHHVQVTVDGETGEITVVGIVEETRFHFLKLRMTTTIKTKVGEMGFRVHDEVENFSASPIDTQILYHINFGEPLLDAGAKFVAPLKTVVPRNARAAEGIKTWESYSAPEAGFAEQVYFLELLAGANGDTQTMLKNAHGTRGVSLYYNIKQLPCYSVWKNTTASADGTVTGLEPGTNFPNPRTYETEQGRVVKIPGGGKVKYDVRLEYHPTASSVEAAEKAIAQIAGTTKPTIFDKPKDGWCAP